MNTRDYKKTGEGGYYHIFNQGNAKNDVFLEEEDYRFFLMRLRQNIFPEEVQGGKITLLPQGAFSLISYCLMPNHFHLLVRQNKSISPSKLISKVCTSYSKRLNNKYHRVGHVFRDQFKLIVLDSDEYLFWLSAYIHLNPVLARFVRDPKEYPWSSYQEFFGQGEKRGWLCDPSVILRHFRGIKEYEIFVREALPKIQERKEFEHLYLE